MTTALYKKKLFGILACCLLLAVLALPLKLHAQSSGAIAQGFPADTSLGDIVTGSLVSFKSDSRSVELATSDSADRLAGVASQDPLLIIAAENKEVNVVLGGTTNVLVSDINGPVRAGDKITASPIAGVGMRTTGEARIVGTAQTDADTSKVETKQITDTRGKTHTVHISAVRVQVGLSYYVSPGSSFLPPFLQSFANSVAGKQVSLIRIVFSIVLLVFSFIGVAVLISSTVRSSIISLGRNPLAAPSIRKSLYQVSGLTIIIIIATLGACYLVLAL